MVCVEGAGGGAGVGPTRELGVLFTQAPRHASLQAREGRHVHVVAIATGVGTSTADARVGTCTHHAIATGVGTSTAACV